METDNNYHGDQASRSDRNGQGNAAGEAGTAKKSQRHGELSEKSENPIQVEFSLSHGLIQPNTSGTIWALVKLSATALKPRSKEGQRLPLNIGLVLDRSGSMAGEPLKYVKEAACFVVEHLAAADWFSLTIFDDVVQILWPSQRVTQKDNLKAAIRNITEGGSTNLSGGFLSGYQEVLKEKRKGQVNRVILLSDGQANVGITDPLVLADKARAMAKRGVTVSTIGVGVSFNEDLMMGLAEAGQGNYYYVKSPEEIPSVFAQELQGLLSVLAQAIKLTVRGESGCRVVGVLGYEPNLTGDGVTVNLPDMYENEEKILILEMKHPALPAGDHEILNLTLNYTDALGALDAVTLNINVRLTAGIGPAESYRPNLEVTKVVELTRAALARDKAVESLDRGDLAGGQKLLEEHLNVLKNLTSDLPAPDPEVVKEIDELGTMLQRLKLMENASGSSAVVADASAMRKDLRYQSYQRRRGKA